MKLFYVVVVACSILISGCVFNMTQNELRSTARHTLFESAKSSKILAPCIADEWKKNANFLTEVQSRPTVDGNSVLVKMVNGGVMFLVDIDDVQGGSTARYYVEPTLTNNPKADLSEWKKAFFECLGDVPTNTAVTPKSPVPNTSTSDSAMSNHNMDCQTDIDCATGFSCRSKSGGGTECRVKKANDKQQLFIEQAKTVEQSAKTMTTPITVQPIKSKPTIEEAKETCASAGFKRKTEKFGRCVLKLTE